MRKLIRSAITFILEFPESAKEMLIRRKERNLPENFQLELKGHKGNLIASFDKAAYRNLCSKNVFNGAFRKEIIEKSAQNPRHQKTATPPRYYTPEMIEAKTVDVGYYAINYWFSAGNGIVEIPLDAEAQVLVQKDIYNDQAPPLLQMSARDYTYLESLFSDKFNTAVTRGAKTGGYLHTELAPESYVGIQLPKSKTTP